MPALEECGLYYDIMACGNRLVQNATSLILNMNNNNAGCYNSILCKFVWGKRVIFARGPSYTTRCEAAAISYNSKGKYHAMSQKSILKANSGKYTRKYAKMVLRRRHMLKERRTRTIRRKLKLPTPYRPTCGMKFWPNKWNVL